MMRIGIDLGGTKIEGVVLDPRGQVAARLRLPTPRGDYDATVATIADIVARLAHDVGQRCSVGIGMPGAMSPATALVKNANSTWLNGRPLQRDIEAAVGQGVRLANDANCFVLSESVDGAASGAHVVFGIILGTGTGGGISIGRQVVTGANAVAGEWGHNPLPWPDASEWPGPLCYCGRRGCIETFLSGPALARDYLTATGTMMDAAAVVARAADGDTGAEAALARYKRRLAKALASVINVLDPDVVVIGGGLSKVERLYDTVPRLWAPWVFSDQIATRLVAPVHGDASGARGAAWLWAVNEGTGR